MSKRSLVIALCAVFIGASLNAIGEYRTKGTVSFGTITGSALAIVICFVMIAFMYRHANKPED
jgi:hypothetical protein